MAFISQRQFTVTVDGITGVFMTKSGGGITSDATKIYSGGSEVPSIITGVPEIENITIGRAYDQGRDDAMLSTLRKQVGRFTTTITVQETDADYKTGTLKKAVYSNCKLVGITEPDYDSSSGDAAMVELEFAVSSVATS